MSEETKIHETTIRLVQGDITDLDVEAFVFYARPDLKLGSGFGNAIAVRGGPGIQKELDEIPKPIPVGEAVVTGAGKLKARLIIHGVGPVFQEEETQAKLRNTIINCLKRAEENALCQIAFPPMGAGFYGVALDVSVRVTLGAIEDYVAGPTGLKEVILVALDNREHRAFASILEREASHV